MAVQEAIAFLVETKLGCKYSKDNQLANVCDIANKALEKQMPKQLDYEGDGYADDGELIYDTAICRSCERKFEFYYDEHFNYCPDCGQKLDWGDTE